MFDIERIDMRLLDTIIDEEVRKKEEKEAHLEEFKAKLLE